MMRSKKAYIIGLLLLAVVTRVCVLSIRADQNQVDPADVERQSYAMATTEMYSNTSYPMCTLEAVTTEPPILDISETYISDEAYRACVIYGNEYGVEPELLMAVIERESSGKPTAENGNCLGLMQVSSYWHADRMERLGCTDLYDTIENIHVGTDYLAELLDRYENVYLALMVYNMGDATAIELFEQGIYSQYATSIVARAEELKELHKYRTKI